MKTYLWTGVKRATRRICPGMPESRNEAIAETKPRTSRLNFTSPNLLDSRRSSLRVAYALAISIFGAGVIGAWAQSATSSTPPSPTPFTVVSRDANSAIWQRTTYEPGPDGNYVPRIHQYTELATGLNHLVNGQWVPSTEDVEISPDGSSAAATNGQHQVYFPGDIYNGVMKLVTPDGKTIQSQPIGLSYYDGTNSVLIAVITNSIGAILPTGNQVIYTNAFAGLDADMLYTYTKAGFEQDVILREQPPDPVALGLNPQTTRLQMLTEFFNPPQPSVTAEMVPTAAGDLEDDLLSFGVMQMGQGRAFLIGADLPAVPVDKEWLELEGRQFLIEEVPIVSVADAIDTLPAYVAQTSLQSKPVASKGMILPTPRLVHGSPKAMFLAKASPPRGGLVLDYITMTTQTNYTFQGDTTYYISGAVTLYGTNTFEGGAVIKYTNSASITLAPGSLNWLARSYHPVVFTAKDDNRVGQTINGSTGNPTNYYANPALELLQVTLAQPISNFRIAYAQQAISIPSSASYYFYNGQVINCQDGFWAQDNVHGYLRNMLFSGMQTNFNNLFSSSFDVQNATFNSSAYLTTVYNAAYQTTKVTFTNCIFASVTALTNSPSAPYITYQISGCSNGFYNCPPFGTGQITNSFYPFQSVGAGSYYLTNGCSFFNAGTTNLDPVLLADLATKTTYPPIVYSNTTISVATTFTPQAQRDTDTPDLGYHYDPIDYFFGGVMAMSNLTFTAGTAAGWFDLPGSDGPGYGMSLHNQVTVAFNGTVTEPCIWAFYDTVQDGMNGLWTDRGWLAGIKSYEGNSYSISLAPQVVASFTHFSTLNSDPGALRDYYTPLVAYAADCEFWSAGAGAYNNSYSFTNCLFDRGGSGTDEGYSGDVFVAQNCTWHGGTLTLVPYNYAIPIQVRDCSFDGTTISASSYGANTNNADYDYNAFTNSEGRFPIGGAHDIIVTNGFNWQTNWFGNYYLPSDSPLIYAGDVLASQVGLYHFTVQTNLAWNYTLSEYTQIPDGTNIVSIGYHYVATDANGNPLDSNNDGIPDYIEDANGNGVVDSGEIGWNITGDVGLNVLITEPRNGSVLP